MKNRRIDRKKARERIRRVAAARRDVPRFGMRPPEHEPPAGIAKAEGGHPAGECRENRCAGGREGAGHAEHEPQEIPIPPELDKECREALEDEAAVQKLRQLAGSGPTIFEVLDYFMGLGPHPLEAERRRKLN